MKFLRRFNENVGGLLSCTYHLSEEVKGYTYWKTRDTVVPVVKADLYFLGYEEYEGIFVEISASGSTVTVVIPDEYFSNYIRNHESKLKKFFKRLGKTILYEDISDSLELTTVVGKVFKGEVLNIDVV